MTYENNEFKVTVNGNKVVVIRKRFGDVFSARLENGKLRAYTSIALSMTMKARSIFGF
jgi:hypothetical protein